MGNNAIETIRMREELKRLYGNSPKWNRKVNLMLPDQVFVVYSRFKKQNKI